MALKPSRTAACCAALACAVLPLAITPSAQALPGDWHIGGTGAAQTIDCNGRTVFVNGTNNTITALGTCWAVTMQGSGNTVIADTVVNDITVYGWNQTVMYKNGNPFIWDRGRELGMTNFIGRAAA